MALFAAIGPGDGHLLLLHTDGGVLAGELHQHGGIGAIGGGGVEDGVGLPKGEVGLHHVLHLDDAFQVVVHHAGLHLGGAAQKLAQQIQGVDGLVNQHAAALGLQAAPPAAFGVVGGLPVPGDESPGAQHLSGLAGGKHLPQQLDAGVIPVLEAHAHPGGGLLQLAELRPLLPGHHRGLFREHVEAAAGRQFRHGGVEVVGGAQVHRVQLFVLQQLLHRAVRPAAVGFGEGLGPLRFDVSAAHQLHTLQVLEHGAVDLGDAAAAHHAYAKVFHVNAPPLPGGCPPGFLSGNRAPASRRISRPGRSPASGGPAPGRPGPQSR